MSSLSFYEPFVDAVMHHRLIHDFVAALIVHGLFERHPTLRLASIENGATWVPGLVRVLRRLQSQNPGMFKKNPVDQFHENVDRAVRRGQRCRVGQVRARGANPLRLRLAPRRRRSSPQGLLPKGRRLLPCGPAQDHAGQRPRAGPSRRLKGLASRAAWDISFVGSCTPWRVRRAIPWSPRGLHHPQPARSRLQAPSGQRRLDHSLILASAVVFLMTLIYFGSVVDPASHLSGLPVLIVNQDRGATVAQGHVDLGAKVVAGLVGSPAVATRLQLSTVTWAEARGTDEQGK